MLNKFLPMMQMTASKGIEIQTIMYGVDCDIYYPKDVGHYSGNHDDIKFAEDPDDRKKLLIPNIYMLKRTPTAGVHDILYQEEFILYAKREFYLPYLTKLVTSSEQLGSYQFLIEDSDSVTTTEESIYREYTLTPFMRFHNNDSAIETIKSQLKGDYDDQISEMMAEDDVSIASSEPDEEDIKFKFRKME